MPIPAGPGAEVPTWPMELGSCSGWAAYSPELQVEASEWATEILWALSGRRYGTRLVTVRPYAGPASTPTYLTYGVQWQGGTEGGWVPYLLDGSWRNAAWGGGSCPPAEQVWLPGPVDSVTEVKIDGVVLPAAAYRVDDGHWLVRQDGGAWPQWQNLNLPAGVAGTWTVAYQQGSQVPRGGEIAAGALACEYAKGRSTGSCAISRQAQSISRGGVTFEVMPEEPSDALTGVAVTDQWLRAVNPGKLRQRPQVTSLDVPTPRTTTWG